MQGHDAPKGPPFLDDLAATVTLVSDALDAPTLGSEQGRRVVETGARLYPQQRPTSLKALDEHRTLFECGATLLGGVDVHGVVVIDKDAGRQVTHLSIRFTPQAGAQASSRGLAQLLATSAKGETPSAGDAPARAPQFDQGPDDG